MEYAFRATSLLMGKEDRRLGEREVAEFHKE
jgi:hypothetical protein